MTAAQVEPAEPPLAGIRVLDLSTLLPGPLATLMLAEAGADVVKIERPTGDEMRSYLPRFGEASGNYAVLNRGKRAYAADFKDPEQLAVVLALAAEADVVIEQFRPGVATRLGLGYEALAALNPGLVYCSISGYGPDEPLAAKAGHDLNFLAESGLLGVVARPGTAPQLPVSVLGDIAGGTYPAVVNILLALRRRDRTGRGVHLQVSMAHNLQVLGYGYFASHQAGGGWPRPGAELLTGGSPRYQIYPTSDGRHIACAALEQRFWERLVTLIGLAPRFREDTGQEEAVIAELRTLFGGHPADHWSELLEGEDVCTVLVSTYDEAEAAGLVETGSPYRVSVPASDAQAPGDAVGALHPALDAQLRHPPATVPYPALEPLARLASPAGGSAWPAPEPTSAPTP